MAEDTAGMMGFYAILFGCAGGIIAGIISDKCHGCIGMKTLLIIFGFLTVASLLGFALAFHFLAHDFHQYSW